jgi:hypothetical protein
MARPTGLTQKTKDNSRKHESANREWQARKRAGRHTPTDAVLAIWQAKGWVTR